MADSWSKVVFLWCALDPQREHSLDARRLASCQSQWAGLKQQAGSGQEDETASAFGQCVLLAPGAYDSLSHMMEDVFAKGDNHNGQVVRSLMAGEQGGSQGQPGTVLRSVGHLNNCSTLWDAILESSRHAHEPEQEQSYERATAREDACEDGAQLWPYVQRCKSATSVRVRNRRKTGHQRGGKVQNERAVARGKIYWQGAEKGEGVRTQESPSRPRRPIGMADLLSALRSLEARGDTNCKQNPKS